MFFVLGLLFSCSRLEEQVLQKPIADSILVAKTLNDSTETKITSEITCPKCGFKKKEMMPDDYCVLKYICTNCKAVLYPDEKDCCVFCSYGTYKCPSKQ